MEKIICLTCNKEFLVSNCRKAKFCSQKCYGISQRNKIGYWKDKKLSEKHKANLKKNHSYYWLGKKHPQSEEIKRKISLSTLGKKHKPFSEEIKKRMRGKNHWNWKGGISRDSHSLTNPKHKQWRSDVFQRDSWTCQTCQKRGCYLEAHHIKSWAKYPKLRFNIDNGITLCKECHKLTDNYKGKNK